MEKVRLAEAFESFDEQWSPRLAGELTIELREAADIELGEGEFVIVPRGVEHRPVAEESAEILLFEPSETRNTGNVDSEETETELERID